MTEGAVTTGADTTQMHLVSESRREMRIVLIFLTIFMRY